MVNIWLCGIQKDYLPDVVKNAVTPFLTITISGKSFYHVAL